MERAEKPFVFETRARRNRTVRVLRINRLVAVILLVGMIASGVIVYFAFKTNKAQNLDKKSYYYVQMGQFTQSSEALSKSLELKNSGGSGFIINDGSFRVMAAVYGTLSEAESVKNKQLAVGRECTVYEVTRMQLRLKKYDTPNETAIIRELLVYPGGSFFLELQKLDQGLDKGELTDSAALLAVAAIKKELKQNHEEIITFLSKYPADPCLNKLEKIHSEIQSIIQNYLPANELTIDTNLKSVLCATVELYTKNLNELAEN